MAEFRQGVITTKGAALLAKAQAGTARITFTKFQIGSGTWSDDTSVETLMSQVNLKNMRAEFAVSKAEYVNEATSMLTLVASNEGNRSGGYYITEVGVYATDGTTEILYAIYLAKQDAADWFPSYNSITPSSITYRSYIAVGNASSVQVNNVTASLVTVKDLEDYDTILRADLDGTIGLLINFTRQQSWELDEEKEKTEKARMMEKGTVTLTNSMEFPFNNSSRSIALSKVRSSTDYEVSTRIVSFVGNVGEIVISDKLVNGFKMEYTGSAPSVTVEYMVIGGFWS